jgi:catechol 2,3-dioxygenase-like lactoylglutathione lyase family enzyme
MTNFAGSIMAVYVRDQEMARRFYVESLGFAELANDKDYEPGLWWIEVAPPRHEVVSPRLALLQPGQLGEGHSGIAFVVHDVQSTYETLKKLDVEFEWEPEERRWGIDAQFLDPNGNKFLIVDLLYHKRPLAPFAFD